MSPQDVVAGTFPTAECDTEPTPYYDCLGIASEWGTAHIRCFHPRPRTLEGGASL